MYINRLTPIKQMEIEGILKSIINKNKFTLDDLAMLLNKLGIFIELNKNKILAYKQTEKALIKHYREDLELDLKLKMYSINEINGLVLFLYINKYNEPQVSKELELFFESLFFNQEGENNVEELTLENNMLVEENKKLNDTIEELKNNKIDMSFEYNGFKSVDDEVLRKMEKELISLKNQIEFEHPLIMEAWYKLCEEFIKKC